MVGALRVRRGTLEMEMAWETLSEVGEWWKQGEVVVRLAERWQWVVEVVKEVMWERWGSEAEKAPVVPLVEVRVRGLRGEEGGNERESRMRQVMEEQKEVEELLEQGEPQGGKLRKQNGEIKVRVGHKFNINVCFHPFV